MHMNKLLPILFLLLLAAAAFAHESRENLPEGVHKLVDQAYERAGSLSLLVALLGGFLSFLSPCAWPILSGFFAYTFKERTQIAKMTLLFSLGLGTAYFLIGALAAVVGEAFQQLRIDVAFWAGIFIIIFGLMTIFGVEFSLFRAKAPKNARAFEMFLFGMAFAIGFTPCVGTIFASILFMATTFHEPLFSGLLTFTYAMGVALPLFIFALFYDKWKLGENKLLMGNTFALNVAGKKMFFNSTKIIAGILLIAIGALYVSDRGTFFFNSADPFGTMEIAFGLQEQLLEFAVKSGIPKIAENAIGTLVIATMLFLALKMSKNKG